MNVEYVRKRYGVPAKRGQRVMVDGRPGRLTSFDHGLWVGLDGDKHPVPAHPTWRVTYFNDDGSIALETGD